jgi:hypothetical protein
LEQTEHLAKEKDIEFESHTICIPLTPNIKIQMLENLYEMVCELQIMFSIEIWGLNGAWKEVDKVHSVFCKGE